VFLAQSEKGQRPGDYSYVKMGIHFPDHRACRRPIRFYRNRCGFGFHREASLRPFLLLFFVFLVLALATGNKLLLR
jgi:hypothetical protein